MLSLLKIVPSVITKYLVDLIGHWNPHSNILDPFTIDSRQQRKKSCRDVRAGYHTMTRLSTYQAEADTKGAVVSGSIQRLILDPPAVDESRRNFI